MGNALSDVRQALQDLGGSAQNNQAVQMLIALVIFMALMQAVQQSDTQATQDGLGMLANLAKDGASSGRGAESGSVYMEQTTISMSSTTIVAAFQPMDTSNAAAGGSLDLQA